MTDTTSSLPIDGSIHWRRNLWVCVFGSFATVVSMTLLLPFLPIYIEELGVHGHAEIVQWSGIAYGATFLSAGLAAPVWGRMADRYGRKLMMIRASLGMAVFMSMIGLAQTVWQLTALRLLAGLVGGYSSGSIILVATQTPKMRSAAALGILSSGIMTGSLLGPLIGGVLPPLIGIRSTFLAAGAIIFVAFLATVFLIKEDPRPAVAGNAKRHGGWSSIPNKRPVVAMLVTGMLLMVANLSIEPILTVYVGQLVGRSAHITIISGIVISTAALGSILSASPLGRFADRVGHSRVLTFGLLASGALLIPQAFVTNDWQLIGLRFAMGLCLGGLMPCITSIIRHSVPDNAVGYILGFSTSAQFAGQVVGPLIGGFVGAHIGLRAVFLVTACLMATGAVFAWSARKRTD
jgi:MFS family permease